MIWKDLKEFCDSLDQEQLEKTVILWREDEAIRNIDVSVLEEDHYISKDGSDEGCYPLSEASKPIEELRRVYYKGDPLLHEDF